MIIMLYYLIMLYLYIDNKRIDNCIYKIGIYLINEISKLKDIRNEHPLYNIIVKGYEKLGIV